MIALAVLFFCLAFVYLTNSEFDYKKKRQIPREENSTFFTSFQNDILTLNLLDTDYQNGYNHGSYMAQEIRHIMQRVDFIYHTILRYPRYEEYRDGYFMEFYYSLPPFLTNEIRGLVDGYNTAIIDSEEELTVEKLIFYHMMVDKSNLYLNRIGNIVPEFGCTTYVNYENDVLDIQRNTDWFSFGVLGNSTIKLNYGTCQLYSFPGIIGGIVARNEENMLFLNVNRQSSVDFDTDGKIPTLFFTRMIMDSSRMDTGLIDVLTDYLPVSEHFITIVKPKDGTIYMVRWKDGACIFDKSQITTNIITNGEDDESMRRLNMMKKCRNVYDLGVNRFNTVNSMKWHITPSSEEFEIHTGNYFAGASEC